MVPLLHRLPTITFCHPMAWKIPVHLHINSLPSTMSNSLFQLCYWDTVEKDKRKHSPLPPLLPQFIKNCLDIIVAIMLHNDYSIPS